MLRALHYSHHLLTNLITKFPEGTFIDATLGNGNDTLYMLNQPNFSGKIYGYDIQEQAIINTQEKLAPHPLQSHVQLIQQSHSTIATTVIESTIEGAIFNLGYLPGGDHSITTHFESTSQALDQIRYRLVKNGQIIIVVYWGHPEGKIEKELLFDYLSQWPQEEFQVLQYEFINQRNQPPMLLIVERIRD